MSTARRRVVLYNPRAVFWTMPLALVAIGSALDRERYEVVIVDARFESDPLAAVQAAINDDTICLGVTVLTGAPIRDALLISRAVKQARARLPIIWGGWHPSLFPDQCLTEPSVDWVVIGQGEDTFAEVVERCATGAAWVGIRGTVSRMGMAPPRALRPVDELPAYDYSLIDVPRYFAAKGKPQFDYISSQGCRFRCTFCADPTVYQRGWYGLDPERMAAELSAHHERYGFNEIAFQDETFFTSRARVEAVAEAFVRAGLAPAAAWTATMRADQGARLDDAMLARCREAGLRRVMIGVESGSDEMLQRIQKDITMEQVYASAERCARQGIGAILNFIVGFPGESDASVQASLDAAARLRAMSPDFEVAIFYFRPYPGNPISDELLRTGYEFSTSLEAWADFDYIGGREAWVTPKQAARIEHFKFYQRFAFGHDRHPLRWPLSRVSRWRVGRHNYSFPIEKLIIERLRPTLKLSLFLTILVGALNDYSV
jgi:anaerobic magnesium-protoporphyrin IX monomethyl ester cyclase